MSFLAEASTRIISFSAIHPLLVYGLICILGLLEGPFLAIITGSLLRLGFLSFIPLYISLMSGDLIGDCLWYGVGYLYGSTALRKIAKLFALGDDSPKRVQKLFNKYHEKILFFSKVTNGFGLAIPILATAGATRVPFGRFITINMLGQFLWTGALIGLGYFFSHLFIISHSGLLKALLAVATIITIYGIYRYSDRLKKQLVS
ncbi:MAG TPA: VTT domain-containing protein [Candidatus Paceibacterota bacterium]|nr:VTT domain-containing protein [Candidatus Paceibacterota bacterium]